MDRETQRQIMRRQLVVIPGGLGMEGPISRLGAWERFPVLSVKSIALLAAAKVALLASLFYYLYY